MVFLRRITNLPAEAEILPKPLPVIAEHNYYSEKRLRAEILGFEMLRKLEVKVTNNLQTSTNVSINV